MGFTAMIDMARSPPTDPSPAKEVPAPMATKPSAPAYPYGLCISLDEESMAKLGMDADDMPKVGEVTLFCALAKVTAVSQNEMATTDGEAKACCRVELQITHLACEANDEESQEARRSRFYGGDEETKQEAVSY